MADYSFNAEVFKKYMKEKRITQGDLVNILEKNNAGLTLATIKKWFVRNKKDGSLPKLQTIKVLCDEWQIPFDEVINLGGININNTDTSLYIPLFEMPTGCGSSGVFDEKFSAVKEVRVAREFLKPFLKPQFLRIFRCIGDSMQPEYNDGDYALVDMVAGREFVKIDGLYVFRVYNEVYAKRLSFLPRKIVAKSINPNYANFEIVGDELENFEILGKICGRFGSNEGLLLDNQGIG